MMENDKKYMIGDLSDEMLVIIKGKKVVVYECVLKVRDFV